jgi:hypothetical protein
MSTTTVLSVVSTVVLIKVRLPSAQDKLKTKK